MAARSVKTGGVNVALEILKSSSTSWLTFLFFGGFEGCRGCDMARREKKTNFKQNRTTGAVRLLMRQEKTHKICLNHLIDPETALSATSGSDNSVNFTASDYADGELKTEKFAVKFRENLDVFKQVFEQAKVSNKSLKQSGAAAKVADKLAGLKVAHTAGKSADAAGQTAAAPAKPEDAEARLAAEFALRQMGGQVSLSKLASAKATPLTGTKYKLALHVKNETSGQVHAHVVTVFVPNPSSGEGMVVLDSKQTGVVS